MPECEGDAVLSGLTLSEECLGLPNNSVSILGAVDLPPLRLIVGKCCAAGRV